MSTWEASLRELVAALNAEANEMPPRLCSKTGKLKYPPSPGWAAAIKRVTMAWNTARALCRTPTKDGPSLTRKETDNAH